MKKYLLWFLALILITNACKEPNFDEENPQKMLLSFTPGNTLEYDETITDSTTLPSALSSLSPELKARYIAKMTRKWHVTVTVPDTNIKDFKIIRELITPALYDTLGPADKNIWKTETYNNVYKEYDKFGVLIRTVNLPSDTIEVDIFYMPFIYADNVAVTDSVRTLFKDEMTNEGQSVTDNGTIIISETSITEGIHNADVKATYDRDYLLPIKNEIIQNNEVVFTEYSYTSVINSFRIITETIEIFKNELDNVEKNNTLNMFPNVNDLEDFFEVEKVKVTVLSNITF
jgi:hypothetical protein